MSRFSKSFLFPDVNLWIALTYSRHIHHNIARIWFENLHDESRICFCRFTQLSLLRLLTTRAVMGEDEVMTQTAAWGAYHHWTSDSRVLFLDEPANLESHFRPLSTGRYAGPKTWADSYLVAFASLAGLQLITFDKGLRGKNKPVLVLETEVG